MGIIRSKQFGIGKIQMEVEKNLFQPFVRHHQSAMPKLVYTLKIELHLICYVLLFAHNNPLLRVKTPIQTWSVSIKCYNRYGIYCWFFEIEILQPFNCESLNHHSFKRWGTLAHNCCIWEIDGKFDNWCCWLCKDEWGFQGISTFFSC